MTSDRDLARWRLRSQRLTDPAPSAAEVVSGLLAVQAENFDQARWAVACRTARPDPADLAGLLDSGAVVRTHVLRSTWHFAAGTDIAWLLELTAPRIRPIYARQLAEPHGWSAQEIDRALAAVVAALAERPDQTRQQVRESLAACGVATEGQSLMLLLGLAETDRLICSGRPADGAHTYALFADRVGDAGRFDRDQALADLAARYFTGHGPATAQDLAYWATLTVGDVRRGIDGARHLLASTEHDGRTFWHAPGEVAPAGPEQPAGHLLQILDETYRGYQDSRMVLDAEGVVPRGRETALGMAVVDAQMVARMKRQVGGRVRFELAPYRPLGAGDLEAVEAAAARYGAFLGLEPEVAVLD